MHCRVVLDSGEANTARIMVKMGDKGLGNYEGDKGTWLGRRRVLRGPARVISGLECLEEEYAHIWCVIFRYGC